MTNIKHYAATALLAGVLALPAAGANAEGMSGAKSNVSANEGAISQQSFSAYDADRSGTLNQSEYDKLGSAVGFDDADTNSDDAVTLAELNKAHSPDKVSSRAAE